MRKENDAMTTSHRLPAFEKFIADLRAAWAEWPDMEARMKKGRELLRRLLQDPALRAASKSWPSTEGRKNLLFYEDPDYGFAINGVVRVPGRKGSIHDHAHSWTAYGLLEGTERLERYRRLDDGSKDGYAKLELASVTEGTPGTVDLVPPFDAHAEQGGPTRSVAVILRSERVSGKVLQGSYDLATNTVRRIDGPTNIPFEIAG
jgi:predicted metal-dependent enzyme (double-stranded beta helix superfamily)